MVSPDTLDFDKPVIFSPAEVSCYMVSLVTEPKSQFRGILVLRPVLPHSMARCPSPWHVAPLHGMLPLSMACCPSPWHVPLHGMLPLSMACCPSPWHVVPLHGMLPLSMACCPSPWHVVPLHGMLSLSMACCPIPCHVAVVCVSKFMYIYEKSSLFCSVV